MNKAMHDPQTTKIYESAGSPPAYLDQPEFQQFVDADSTRLIAAVKKIGKVE
jgi:tripartite-type tricarboxylate transporter receptor subunit TctC